MASNGLGEALGRRAGRYDDMETSQGINPSLIHSYFVFGRYRIRVRVTRLEIEKRSIGTSMIWGSSSQGIWGEDSWGESSSFILGHSTNGILGESELGSGSLGEWETVEVINIDQDLHNEIDIAKLFAGESVDNPSHFAVGSDDSDIDYSNNTLGDEIARKEITVTYNSTDKEVEIETMVPSTDSSFQDTDLEEVGIFNDGSSGDMFTRILMSTLNMDDSFDYRFTIKMEIEDDSLGNSNFTIDGMNEVRDWFAGSSITEPTHVAWGTGTDDASESDSELGDEVVRNEIDRTTRERKRVSYDSRVASDEANGEAITESGLLNSGSGGTLYTRSVFGSIEKTEFFRISETDRVEVR